MGEAGTDDAWRRMQRRSKTNKNILSIMHDDRTGIFIDCLTFSKQRPAGSYCVYCINRCGTSTGIITRIIILQHGILETFHLDLASRLIKAYDQLIRSPYECSAGPEGCRHAHSAKSVPACVLIQQDINSDKLWI